MGGIPMLSSFVSATLAVSAASATAANLTSIATSNATICNSCSLLNDDIPISKNQIYKNPRPVELLGRERAVMIPGMSESEWHDRLELAALARILYIYGFGSDLAAQCVMARLRDEPDAMLMNEWGLFFEETTASSLVKVRFGTGTPSEGLRVAPDGSVAPSKPDVVNIGCVPVGRAIFDARPDVYSIIHAHPHAVMAVASTGGLLPVSQAAFFLHGTIGHYKYEFSYDAEFEDGIAKQFASGKRAVMLEHHGLYAVGSSAKDAWFVTFHLHQACEVQLRAQGSGQPLVMPERELLDRQYLDMMSSPDYAYDGSREWAGCVRKLNRELPGYEQ